MASIPSGAFMYRSVRAELSRQRSQEQQHSKQSVNTSCDPTTPTTPNPSLLDDVAPPPQHSLTPHSHHGLTDTFFHWANHYTHYKHYGMPDSSKLSRSLSQPTPNTDSVVPSSPAYTTDTDTGYRSDGDVQISSSHSSRDRHTSGPSSYFRQRVGTTPASLTQRPLKARAASSDAGGSGDDSDGGGSRRGGGRSWSFSVGNMWGKLTGVAEEGSSHTAPQSAAYGAPTAPIGALSAPQQPQAVEPPTHVPAMGPPTTNM